mgnify:FL=1
MTLKKTFDWIRFQSKLPWLPLDISLPHQEMLEEARAIKHRFVPHRDEDIRGGYSHRGWKSICLHGIAEDKTNHYESYGYKNNDSVPYHWTKASYLCPVTTKWLTEVFPMRNYYRVRYMLLEPNGFIAPHTDTNTNYLSPINIALNHPKGCIFKMQNHGVVPMRPGSVMMLDVGNTHAYINNSNEDRYHIIIHGEHNTEYKNLVENSYKKIYE